MVELVETLGRFIRTRTKCTYEEQLIRGETVVRRIEDAVVAHQSFKPESILCFMSIDPAKADNQRTGNRGSNVLT